MTELEVDVLAVDILNRHELSLGKLARTRSTIYQEGTCYFLQRYVYPIL